MSKFINDNGVLDKVGSNIKMRSNPIDQYVTEGELIETLDDYTTKEELATKQDIIQFDIMPEASVDLVGNVVQYVGETNSNYIQGNWYKCQLNTNTSTYEWIEFDISGEITPTNEYDGVLISDTTDNIGVHLGTIQEWENASYAEKYGFGGYPYGYNNLPPKNQFTGIVEADMLYINGGKGRWNGKDTGNAVCGGHVLEGWNATHESRVTIGVGLSHKDVSVLQHFHPATSSSQNDTYYGVIKIGDDRVNTGTSFCRSMQKNSGLMCLSTSIPNDTTVSTDKLVETGELLTEDYNATTKIPYGAMYFDKTNQRVKVYTSDGWKSLSWEV